MDEKDALLRRDSSGEGASVRPNLIKMASTDYGSMRRCTTQIASRCAPPAELSSRSAAVLVGISACVSSYSSALNILLICMPLGAIATALGMPDPLVFGLNFAGMVPLALLLSRATEDIAEHTNSTLGALLNVTLGNAVELIISVSALRAGKVELLQNTLVGSVLSNLLLVLGSAFFVGGLVFKEQRILQAVSETNKDLLTYSIFALTIPVAFKFSLVGTAEAKRVAEERFSLLVACAMLTVYALFMVFANVTHADQFEDSNESSLRMDEEVAGARGTFRLSEAFVSFQEPVAAERDIPPLRFAVPVLFISMVLVIVSSEFLVQSLDGFSKSFRLSTAFTSVILLPVIGNAVEHMSAVLVAAHDKIDLAVGIAIGSSVQIALFATPFLVVISWFIPGERITLVFSNFHIIALFMSVLVVNSTLADAKTNILEGVVLVACYVVLGGAYFLFTE